MTTFLDDIFSPDCNETWVFFGFPDVRTSKHMVLPMFKSEWLLCFFADVVEAVKRAAFGAILGSG